MTDATDSPSKPLFDHDGRSVMKVNNGVVKVSDSEKLLTLQHKLDANCHLTEDVDSSFRVTGLKGMSVTKQ